MEGTLLKSPSVVNPHDKVKPSHGATGVLYVHRCREPQQDQHPKPSTLKMIRHHGQMGWTQDWADTWQSTYKRMRHTSYMTFTSEGESHRRKLNNPDLIKIPLPGGCLLWSRPLTTINENIGKYQPVQMCNKNDTKEEIKLPVFADVIILCRNTKNIPLKETFRANGVHLGCGIWNKHKKTSFQWYWAITKWNQGTILKAIFKRIKYLE